MNNRVRKFLPLSLTAVLLIVDRLSKIWIIKHVPVNTVYKKIAGDFLWIWHVRNTGIAFSFGSQWPDGLRIAVFSVIPLLVMILLIIAVVKNKLGFTERQRWYLCGVIGGGIGTLIDRFFYFKDGVVDFISIKLYGFLGMERWPTFNFSDSFVVVFVILLLLSFVTNKAVKKKE